VSSARQRIKIVIRWNKEGVVELDEQDRVEEPEVEAEDHPYRTRLDSGAGLWMRQLKKSGTRRKQFRST
jgi:hypothetical protein